MIVCRQSRRYQTDELACVAELGDQLMSGREIRIALENDAVWLVSRQRVFEEAPDLGLDRGRVAIDELAIDAAAISHNVEVAR